MGSPVCLIVLDDVGKSLLAAANMPNLDTFCSTARNYRNFVVSPKCSNTRARIHSGLHSYRLGNRIGDILPNPSHPGYSLPYASGLLLAQRIPGFKSVVGKWHLDKGTNYDHPLNCGFSAFSGTMMNLQGGGGGSGTYFQFEKIVAGAPVTCTQYATADVASDAVRSMQLGARLVVCNFHSAHTPLHVPPDGMYYQQPPWTNETMSVAMLEAVDYQLGRIFYVGANKGFIFIIMSDNGNGPGILEGGKDTMYEKGINTPMWVGGPGVVPGVSDLLVGATDLNQTIVELEGNGGGATPTDSFGFAADILGGTVSPPEFLHCDFYQDSQIAPTYANWHRSVRNATYKLIVKPGPVEEFFDLIADPTETTNLLNGAMTQDQTDNYTLLQQQLPVL